eukprot:SAG11_NODE_7831_length_1090_cov_7.255298_2_plen_210_part_00
MPGRCAAKTLSCALRAPMCPLFCSVLFSVPRTLPCVPLRPLPRLPFALLPYALHPSAHPVPSSLYPPLLPGARRSWCTSRRCGARRQRRSRTRATSRPPSPPACAAPPSPSSSPTRYGRRNQCHSSGGLSVSAMEIPYCGKSALRLNDSARPWPITGGGAGRGAAGRPGGHRHHLNELGQAAVPGLLPLSWRALRFPMKIPTAARACLG